MALQIAKNDAQGNAYPQAYAVIVQTNYTKGRTPSAEAYAKFYASKSARDSGLPEIADVNFGYAQDISPGAPEAVTQAYTAFSALPEMAGAVAC